MKYLKKLTSLAVLLMLFATFTSCKYINRTNEKKEELRTSEDEEEIKIEEAKEIEMEEIKVEGAVTMNQQRVSSKFSDGSNILKGDFIFNGANYGFTVTFDYDSSTEKASNPTYEAHGYGSVSKLSQIEISPDGNTIYIAGTASGTKTIIRAQCIGRNLYEGKMTRGNNSGICHLQLL